MNWVVWVKQLDRASENIEFFYSRDLDNTLFFFLDIKFISLCHLSMQIYYWTFLKN